MRHQTTIRRIKFVMGALVFTCISHSAWAGFIYDFSSTGGVPATGFVEFSDTITSLPQSGIASGSAFKDWAFTFGGFTHTPTGFGGGAFIEVLTALSIDDTAITAGEFQIVNLNSIGEVRSNIRFNIASSSWFESGPSIGFGDGGSGNWIFSQSNVVPEPSSLTLFICGILLLGVFKSREQARLFKRP